MSGDKSEEGEDLRVRSRRKSKKKSKAELKRAERVSKSIVPVRVDIYIGKKIFN